MIVYIAGRMTGTEDYGRAAFRAAAREIAAAGDTPLSPAILPTTLKKESYMPICLAMIQAADAVYMLQGWEQSGGATIEKLYAEYQHKEIMYQPITAEESER